MSIAREDYKRDLPSRYHGYGNLLASSDGITLAPSFDLNQYGKEHDVDYEIGGDEFDRLAADLRFAYKIAIHFKKFIAPIQPFAFVFYNFIAIAYFLGLLSARLLPKYRKAFRYY